MKPYSFNVIIISVFIILSFSCRNHSTDIPVINASKSYPEKEIFLNDIANISYVSMRPDGNYLYSGSIYRVSESRIIICDAQSGDILFFSREGNPISRFNNKGRGPGEYLFPMEAMYDEKTDELFLVDMGSIKVYSSSGIFKRGLPLPEGAMVLNHIVSFDERSLFFYDLKKSYMRGGVDAKDLSESDYREPYYLVSKADGEILDYFEMAIKPVSLSLDIDGFRAAARVRHLIKSDEGVFICNPQNDTIFLYARDRSLTPVFAKTPEVSSMNPMVFINNCVELGQYQFTELCTIKRGDPIPGFFPMDYYMRDKKSGEIFRQRLRVHEYKDKELFISPLALWRRLYDNGCVLELDLLELKEAYDNNLLSGKLKELVETLDEDDNNVFVFVEFKN